MLPPAESLLTTQSDCQHSSRRLVGKFLGVLSKSQVGAYGRIPFCLRFVRLVLNPPGGKCGRDNLIALFESGLYGFQEEVGGSSHKVSRDFGSRLAWSYSNYPMAKFIILESDKQRYMSVRVTFFVFSFLRELLCLLNGIVEKHPQGCLSNSITVYHKSNLRSN